MPESFWQTPAGLRHVTPPGCQQPEGFDVYQELRELSGDHSVLEFGCGTGRLSPAFLPNRYLGVDVSPGAINEAQHGCPEHPYLLYRGGPLPRFDMVLAWTVLLHVHDDEIARTVQRLVKATRTQIVIGEIMGRSWRRLGDPPVFNREPLEYVALLEAAGMRGGIRQYAKPCVRYPNSHYTIIVGQK